MSCVRFVFLLAATATADASSLCASHPGCAVLEGNCCPSDNGITLACCSAPAAAPVDAQPVTAAPVDSSGDGGSSGGGAVDPAGCAVDITAGIAAITSAAKSINYAVEDCPESSTTRQRACADDITSAITDFAGASKAIASATYTCGGSDTTCARDIINSVASLSAASETLISAATDCDRSNAAGYDAFSCIVDIFDVVDTLVHFSKSIYDAVDHCGPAQPVQSCDAASKGQKQVVVVDCEGTGCNANGDDNDCAWCVTDMEACHTAFGEVACSAVQAARQAQGVDCNQAGNDVLPNERRLTFNV